MELFSFLEGMSPWWWVAFGLALGGFEMATMSFFLIWPGIAAVLTALLLVVAPKSSGSLQVVFFAVLAMVLTFIGRYLLDRFGDGGETTETLNSRSALMIGRHAEVLDFTGPEGHVKIDGVRWRAVWSKGATAEVGQTVHIGGADGMMLKIGPSAD